MSKPKPIELAGRFGVSKQAINNFINQGMPIDSIESAEAWLMQRRARANGGGQTVRPDKDFTETVEKQRELKALAYEHYLSDLRSGAPEAAKSYATYDKLVKTLVTLEKELHARQIASKEFIRTQTAVERFGKILNDIRSELTQLGTKVASRANPDNPGRALKSIDDEVNNILSRVSQAVGDAEDTVKGDDTEEALADPVIVEDDDSNEDEVEDSAE
jgi:hypothetical protein